MLKDYKIDGISYNVADAKKKGKEKFVKEQTAAHGIANAAAHYDAIMKADAEDDKAQAELKAQNEANEKEIQAARAELNGTANKEQPKK